MYLSRRRLGHSQALLEVEESDEDGMRWLWLRRDTRRACVRMRHPTLDERHACTRSGRAAHHNPRAHPPPPPCSPPRLSTYTATIRIPDVRAETFTLGTRLHKTPPSKSLAAWTPGS